MTPVRGSRARPGRSAGSTEYETTCPRTLGSFGMMGWPTAYTTEPSAYLSAKGRMRWTGGDEDDSSSPLQAVNWVMNRAAMRRKRLPTSARVREEFIIGTLPSAPSLARIVSRFASQGVFTLLAEFGHRVRP